MKRNFKHILKLCGAKNKWTAYSPRFVFELFPLQNLSSFFVYAFDHLVHLYDFNFYNRLKLFFCRYLIGVFTILERFTVMHLNEKCLINYLQKPDELLYTTRFLNLINKIIEKKFISKSVFNKIKIPKIINEVLS